jgi:hypothetical protein
MTNIEKEMSKIKYQLRMIMETIDFDRYPIQYLILELDWDDSDLTKANDIFEEYSNKLEKNEDVDWIEFELKLRQQFNIGYQTVKLIILAFYRNSQWVSVCEGYANHSQASEFWQILEK